MATCYEPFLLDEKMLPMLEEVELRAVPVPHEKMEFKTKSSDMQFLESRTVSVSNSKSNLKMEFSPRTPDTQLLLKEFEIVYDGFNNCALTPPQSPPMELTSLEIFPQANNKCINIGDIIPVKQAYTLSEKSLIQPQEITYDRSINISSEYPSMVTHQTDVASGLAVVDELVRTAVEDMHWINSQGSPDSSRSSNFEDSSSDDPEWVPEPVENHEVAFPFKTVRNRSKPYAKNVDDKKYRKKEQNKEAATRYRLKKKAEVEVILGEEKVLLDKNNDLSTKITDLQKEIKYLKGLMRDMFKAKGLIN